MYQKLSVQKKKQRVSFSLKSQGSRSKKEHVSTNRPLDGKLPEPSLGMIVGDITVDDHLLYERYFKARPFCPIVCVDLAHFKEKCNLDLTNWLLQFMPLLGISKLDIIPNGSGG